VLSHRGSGVFRISTPAPAPAPAPDKSKASGRDRSAKIMSEKQRLRVSTSITYTAVLDFSRETVLYLARLLEAERRILKYLAL
jgi:hypothetical protein